ncbi:MULTISPECIES: hypothetical protein [Paraburkholderia]|uniref:Uncharacterized protein n=2 Tax=Paraburkholderia TaxID=1822464 RepID=A0A7Y9W695_9BURK|nr:hypothetical protein [Paraburkholderia bryophila]NYH14950.1 hypothetical protein [Paraburkholderia bryophila]NYH26717.1 hypothetical protein [Paraburkholderia bryophila]
MLMHFDHHARTVRKLDTFAPPALSPQRFAPLEQTPIAAATA